MFVCTVTYWCKLHVHFPYCDAICCHELCSSLTFTLGPPQQFAPCTCLLMQLHLRLLPSCENIVHAGSRNTLLDAGLVCSSQRMRQQRVTQSVNMVATRTQLHQLLSHCFPRNSDDPACQVTRTLQDHSLQAAIFLAREHMPNEPCSSMGHQQQQPSANNSICPPPSTL